MKKLIGLLWTRRRAPRPARTMSVPGDLARQYRFTARCFFVLGIAGFGYGLYERANHAEAMARPPSSVVTILSAQGVPLRTFSADDMDEAAWNTVATAIAAQHVVRMRRVTNPIDFTLADIREGGYWIKEGSEAAVKVRQWLGGRPFDAIAKRRQERVVLLENVIATIRPGHAVADKVMVTVQWPERIEANGSPVSETVHGGQVMVERAKSVSPQVAKHNPMGVFVSDFSFDTAD